MPFLTTAVVKRLGDCLCPIQTQVVEKPTGEDVVLVVKLEGLGMLQQSAERQVEQVEFGGTLRFSYRLVSDLVGDREGLFFLVDQSPGDWTASWGFLSPHLDLPTGPATEIRHREVARTASGNSFVFRVHQVH